MAKFLILSPFVAFTALMMWLPAAVALAAGASLAFVVVAIDWWRGRSFKVFQAGAALTFSVLAGYVALIDPAFAGNAVRSAVDAGLLAVILMALAAGVPFTIQYAREEVDADIAARDEFRRANYFLTGVWIVALLTMLAADLCAIFVAWMPLWAGVAAAFAARNGAMAFTQWFAAKRRAKVAAERAILLTIPSPIGGEIA